MDDGTCTLCEIAEGGHGRGGDGLRQGVPEGTEVDALLGFYYSLWPGAAALVGRRAVAVLAVVSRASVGTLLHNEPWPWGVARVR
jgi:hypothetical protein